MDVIYSLLFASFLILAVSEAKTKLPSGMSQHQYCHGCIATIKELDKKLSKRRITKKNRESKIMEVMENICEPNNFVTYEYSPPKTQKACKLLLENHDEDLETAFVKEKSNIEQLICHEVSGACDGVDTTKKDKTSKFADVDMSSNGGGTVSKTVKLDPNSGDIVIDGDKKKSSANDGKTLSKKSKKKQKKEKKKKEKKQKKEKKKSKDTRDTSGQKKGSINHINVDINDPSSMEDIVKKIQQMTGQQGENKDEL